MEPERVRLESVKLNLDTKVRQFYVVNVMGIEDKLYLTEKQVKELVKANNRPEYRQNFMQVGRYIFKPSSVTSMELKSKEFCYLPIYLQERIKIEEEKIKLIGGKKDDK